MKALIWFIVIFVTAVCIGYLLSKEERLPVYRPSRVNPRLVDSDQRASTNPHSIRDFKLVSQLGDTITSEVLTGKVYVADFFFTRCPTICPVMTSNLADVHKKFADRDDFLILSHSVTPEYDTPDVLLAYSMKYGANPRTWLFLTGDKQEIYDLARRSYFAVFDYGDGDMQDFIHTENVILVDSHRRIRGFYDGTSEKEMQKMASHIRILLKEIR